MSVYRRPARSDELYHWGKGSTSKNHKYIDKIGNRYFYTMEELQAFKEGATNKVKRGMHSFDKSRQAAINKIGGARDRVAKALGKAQFKLTNKKRAANVRNDYFNVHSKNGSGAVHSNPSNGVDAAQHYSNRQQAESRFSTRAKTNRVEDRRRSAAVAANNNRSKLSREDSRSQRQGQTTNAGQRIARNANIAANNIKKTISSAGNAIREGYDNDIRKPMTRVSGNAKQAGRNLSDTVTSARNAVRSGYENDVKKPVKNAAKSGRDYVESRINRISNNARRAGNNLSDTVNSARNAVRSGYENDVKKPAKKVAGNAKQAERNLLETFSEARDAISRGYDEDIRKRRKRR